MSRAVCKMQMMFLFPPGVSESPDSHRPPVVMVIQAHSLSWLNTLGIPTTTTTTAFTPSLPISAKPLWGPLPPNLYGIHRRQQQLWCELQQNCQDQPRCLPLTSHPHHLTLPYSTTILILYPVGSHPSKELSTEALTHSFISIPALTIAVVGHDVF